MVTSKQSSKGFTLIELLVAMSILMMIMFAGYYAYDFFSGSWKKRSDYFWQVTQKSLALESISRVFASVSPYIVTSDKEQPAFYFHGDNSRIIFITGSPVFSSVTSLVELEFVKTDEQNVKLVYKEAPLSQLLLLHQSTEIFWQQQAVVVDNIRQGNFTFHGWSNYQQVLNNLAIEQQYEGTGKPPVAKPSWYSTHEMQIRRILPIKVRLQYTLKSGEEVSLAMRLPENSHIKLVHYLREDA